MPRKAALDEFTSPMKRLRLTCWLAAGFVACAGILIGLYVERRGIPPGAGAGPARAAPRTRGDGASIDGLSGPDDYPAFRGADGLATIRSANLAADWNSDPPRELWRRKIGAGWGAFAIAGGRAFTQEQRGAEETVVCYELSTGRKLWVHADAAHFQDPEGGDGPRATPTAAGDRVFALGATGILNCLDSETGKRQWTVDVFLYNGADTPYHGASGSPLVAGDLVNVSAGGIDGRSLVAYERQTGRRVWQAGADPAGYGSPLTCEICGKRQIVILNQPGLAAHDPRTGAVLWTYPWENSLRSNCSQPVPLGDGRLFVSSGHGRGCAVLQIRREGDLWSASPIWTARRMNTKFTSVVVRDRFAYGLDNGILSCIDLSDGARRWKGGRYGNGQLLLAGDLLVVQTESGDVVLVDAAPEQHRELPRYPALAEKTWNNPALAGRFLLLRNDREAVCLELPLNR
jgi:outer membrane protein assembly factor BamB